MQAYGAAGRISPNLAREKRFLHTSGISCMQEAFLMAVMMSAVSALTMMSAGALVSVMMSAVLAFLVMVVGTDRIRIIAEASF